MLERLTPEILSLVAEQVHNRKDLNSLSRASRTLYDQAAPVLYRNLSLPSRVFTGTGAEDIFDVSVLAKNPRNLKYVRHLWFSSDWKDEWKPRCKAGKIELPNSDTQPDKRLRYMQRNIDLLLRKDHISAEDLESYEAGLPYEITQDPERRRFEAERYARTANHLKYLSKSEEQLMPIVEALQDGQLQSFSWKGYCIDGSLLGFLLWKQPQLALLSLNLDVRCPDCEASMEAIATVERLQRFNWITKDRKGFQYLARVIQGSRETLKSLKIDYGSFEYDRGIDTPNPFTHVVLKIDQTESFTCQALQRLNLTSVSFISDTQTVISTFQIPQLQSLTIRDCIGLSNMLGSLANCSLQLRYFELAFTGENQWNIFYDEIDMSVFVTFLQSFKGLEELRIFWPEYWEMGDSFWRAIAHHHATLTTLIHQRGCEETTDLLDRVLLDSSEVLWSSADRLKRLAVACEPSILQRSLVGLERKPPLRLLHFRPGEWQTTNRYAHGLERAVGQRDMKWLKGIEAVEKFAEWAFGPDGLSELDMLAYGSFNPRKNAPRTLLCRADRNARGQAHARASYRAVNDRELWLHELLWRNADFLEAQRSGSAW